MSAHENMDFERAPRANLATWALVRRIMVWSGVAIAVVLSLMAITLT